MLYSQRFVNSILDCKRLPALTSRLHAVISGRKTADGAGMQYLQYE